MKVYVLVPGLVSAPRPVPTGESMLSCVIESPPAAVKAAVMVEDWPSCIVAPRDEVMVAVGVAGAVTARDAGHVAETPTGFHTVPV